MHSALILPTTDAPELFATQATPDAQVLSPADAARLYASVLPGPDGRVNERCTRAALRALHGTLRAALPGLSRGAHDALLAEYLNATNLPLSARLEQYERDAEALGAGRSGISATLRTLHDRQGN